MEQKDEEVDLRQNNRNITSSSWLNQDFAQSSIVGIIIAVGFMTASIFRINFMVEPETARQELVAFCFVPLASLILVVEYMNGFLTKLGFKKIQWHKIVRQKKEDLTVLKACGFIFGLFFGFYLCFLLKDV